MSSGLVVILDRGSSCIGRSNCFIRRSSSYIRKSIYKFHSKVLGLKPGEEIKTSKSCS